MADNLRVTAHALNVRNAPRITGGIVGHLSRGDLVEKLDISGDLRWYKIRKTGGITGWSSVRHLELVSNAPALDGESPWVAVAQNEIGTREVGGAGDNPRITEYLHSTSVGAPYWNNDETHWCSAFVNWCMERAGYEGTNSARARSWLNWGRRITEPVPGAITVFWRETVNSGLGHVAFFVRKEGSQIIVLGGNQDDAVNEAPYPESRLLGYRLPGLD